jgi:N-dimethylarginine dimethylaminohydrolase
MISLKINNEYAQLKTVVLGIAKDFGGTPKMEDCYDPKSREHVKNGNFPIEESLVNELNQFLKVFKKYNVEVLRPDNIKNLNQVFSRDIAFVIEDKIIIPNIINERKEEIDGVKSIIEKIDSKNIVMFSEQSSIEGGDIIVHDEDIFIGYSNNEDFDKYQVARTNEKAVLDIKDLFPKKNIFAFELKKSDRDPKENALHLDCCFQPIGKGMAILYEGGFKNKSDITLLESYFGTNNLIRITKEEMYNMNSNVFSISENVIVSEKNFYRLNSILRESGFYIEEINFSEIAKMEGLLRCATLPLIRL